MAQLQGKRILIFQQRRWGLTTGRFLASRLQAEGCRLAALAFKKQTYQFITEQKDVKYDLVVDANPITDDPKAFLGKDNYSLEQICDGLGVDSIWPLVQSSRHYVKSYVDKYYYGFKQGESDEDIVYLIKAIYKSTQNIFEEFKPELIITPNFASLLHIMFNLYADKHGVKMLRLTDSRIKGVSVAVYDYQESKGPFFIRLKELNSGIKSSNIEKAQEYIAASSKKLIIPQHVEDLLNSKNEKFIKKLRRELSPYRKILRYWLAGNFNKSKNRRVTPDDLPPRYILRDHYAHKRYTKFANAYNYANLAEIDKYIYFPLQFQPEETIDVLAPHFNNQIETVRQVAMSAPGGYTVVVKDHPTMVGYRASSYLEKIARTPNVKLIDYRTPAEKVLRSAAMVVSLSGTTLVEAAFLRKPAIQFGDLGLTQRLPNVFKHSDFLTLARRIKELLALDLNTKEYDQQLLNYISAAYDVGTDINYTGLWTAKSQDQMNELWQFYKKELINLL